jgi:hypothetical protein
VLGRLLGQLKSLGVRRAWVVTRPRWKAAIEAAAAETGVDATVVTAERISDDLFLAAEVAEQIGGPLMIGKAHAVTHQGALAWLLADPQAASGVLSTPAAARAHWSFAIRSTRGRVVSASSPYHRASRPTGYFLGLMKIEARDLARLVTVSKQLARLATGPLPEAWEAEYKRKSAEWRQISAAQLEGKPASAGDDTQLDPDSEAELTLRRRVAGEDIVSLLLVGLIRENVEFSPSDLRKFSYAAPVSAHAAALAARELSARTDDRAMLDSAVKSGDGFFTTFFVSPYSKYLARFAARRGWTPNEITIASLGVGLLAAASFALGTRFGLILGAVLLQVSFTVDCVDGQLARYTRTFSKLGAWLDSVFDRMKEYLVYGGLALGSTRGFGEDVWTFAAAALTLQTVRHLSDFSWVTTRRAAIPSPSRLPLDVPDDDPTVPVAPAQPTPRRRLVQHAVRTLKRSRVTVWGNRIVRLPIGERFALISVTAAIGTPRVTFIALLAWGGAAALYALSVRILMSYSVPQRIVRSLLR